MNQINLEAEQVVGEEEEAPPETRRQLFVKKKAIIIFGAILIVEAVVLFAFFEVVRSDPATAETEQVTSSEDFAKHIASVGKIEVGPVEIIDENDMTPNSDRLFSCRFDVYLEKEVYDEIIQVTDNNPHAMTYVERVIAQEIRNWMLDLGGESLKNKEMQRLLDVKLKNYLNDRLPPLRNRIVKVFSHDLSVRRY